MVLEPGVEKYNQSAEGYKIPTEIGHNLIHSTISAYEILGSPFHKSFHLFLV